MKQESKTSAAVGAGTIPANSAAEVAGTEGVSETAKKWTGKSSSSKGWKSSDAGGRDRSRYWGRDTGNCGCRSMSCLHWAAAACGAWAGTRAGVEEGLYSGLSSTAKLRSSNLCEHEQHQWELKRSAKCLVSNAFNYVRGTLGHTR